MVDGHFCFRRPQAAAVLPPMPKAVQEFAKALKNSVAASRLSRLVEIEPQVADDPGSKSSVEVLSPQTDEDARERALEAEFIQQLRDHPAERLTRRRGAIREDATPVANAAAWHWFYKLCHDVCMSEEGPSSDDGERVKAALERTRATVDVGEAYFFINGLDEEEREEWEKLCKMGVVAPWDPISRQRRYVVKAVAAAQQNIREQIARHREQSRCSKAKKVLANMPVNNGEIGKIATTKLVAHRLVRHRRQGMGDGDGDGPHRRNSGN